MVAALKRAGFAVRRQSGSHIVLRHPETQRMAIVPDHPGTLGPGLVSRILRQAGLAADEFRQLLR